MEMRFDAWCLDVDLWQTRAYYATAASPSAACGCEGCRNYDAVARQLPPKVKDFFSSLGVDAGKAAEVFIPILDKNGLLWYSGFYHLCGVLLEGGEEYYVVWREETDPAKGLYQISFSTACNLLSPRFPRPAMQMSFSAWLPWLLPEENTYT